MSFLGQRVNAYVVLLDVAKFYSMGIVSFFITMSNIKSAYFLTALPTVVKLLDFCQPDRGEIVTQCNFNWHFSYYE